MPKLMKWIIRLSIINVSVTIYHSMIEQVFIISDGTGRTAQQVLSAAMMQFENKKVQTTIYPHVGTKKQILEIIVKASHTKSLILFTVVSQKLRDVIHKQCRLYDVETIDLMGPLLAHFSQHFSHLPSEKPGIYYELNKSYFKRIEAVEYTLRHDDGQRTEGLDKAEIVILGVSRTVKTPVSVYLAHKGWLVANIPIVLGMEPPEELFKIPPQRVFCLTTTPNHLSEQRKVREKHLGGNLGDYAKLSFVMKELEFANNIYKRQARWTKIDVTNKPIEEISMEILSGLRKSNE
jgi:[pyruvate, water dikinase]-phosphate phosphotransferase / [pyruvate, water dikinase] kinase